MVKFLPRKKTSGQALIILLLVMVVGLTVGLSVATRTATDVRLTSQQESSQKAFSAAEAGIEDVLRRDLSQLSGASIQNTVGDSSYVVSINAQGGGSTIKSNTPVERDTVTEVVLAPATATPPEGLNIYWIDTKLGETTATAASLEITEIYIDSSGSYQMRKFAFNHDCDATSSTNEQNNFLSVNTADYSCTTVFAQPVIGKNFNSKVYIKLSSSPSLPQLVRIKPLYSNTSVAVQADPAGRTIPVQGFLVESTGVSGDIARRVQVFRSLETLPSIFDYVLYSGTNLNK